MQIFGLISLLIVIAIGATWTVSSMGGGVSGEDGNVQETTYNDALDSARGAADQIEGKTKILSLPSKRIEVYDGISVPEDSRILDLSGQGLSGSLKGEIRFLTSLEELDLSNNNFSGLPAEVGQLSKLEVLNLSSNPFTGLPYELGNLQNLRVLDLRGTEYSVQDLAIIKKNLPASTQILTN